MSNTKRWKKGIKSELQHFTEVSGLQIVPQDRMREILSRWNIESEYFRNKKVLAVGGGTGIVHQFSNSRLAISIDPLNNSIYPEIEKDSEATALTGAGEHLPFKDSSMDIIISANVIDHTANPHKCISEIARVLKPGGKFLFDINIFNTSLIMRRLADYFDRPHPHHFDAVEVQELLLSSFDEVILTHTKRIPFGASPALFNRLKIFVANTIFNLRKVCYVCEHPSF